MPAVPTGIGAPCGIKSGESRWRSRLLLLGMFESAEGQPSAIGRKSRRGIAYTVILLRQEPPDVTRIRRYQEEGMMARGANLVGEAEPLPIGAPGQHPAD